MTIGLRDLDWVAHNMARAYPFTWEASRTSTTGDFTIPVDFIIGVTLSTHWGQNVQTGSFFVRKIVAYPSGFQVTIGYNALGGPVDAARAIVPKAGHKLGNYYNLLGLGDFSDSKGFLQIGDFENVTNQPTGAFEFDFAAGRLEPDAIHPYIRGVSGIQVQNGSSISAPIYGNVVLRSGNNMRIETLLVDGQDPEIIFNAISGEGFTEICDCNPSFAGPVKTLSMVGPDSQGNINLIGNNCFSITAGENALIIHDSCSQPCCGCKELEEITRTIQGFSDNEVTFRNFLVGLEQRTTQTDQVVLGSRLGDRGCSPPPT